MSSVATGWAWQQRVPNAAQKLVLLALANYHSGDGRVHLVGQALLAEMTCMTERTVRRALDALEAAKLVVREPRKRYDDGTWAPDSYRLTDSGDPADKLSGGPADKLSGGYPPDEQESSGARARSRKARGSNVTKRNERNERISATVATLPSRLAPDGTKPNGNGVADASNDSEHEPDDRPLSWSERACAIWEARMQGSPPGGRIGRALKPLVVKHGEAEVMDSWDRYLVARVEQGRATFATPEDFAGKYGYYKQHGFAEGNGTSRTHRTTQRQVYAPGTPAGTEIKWKR